MLLRGRLLSCGCLRERHGHNRRGKRTQTYGVWVNMRTRCYGPASRDYKDYGARGITVCDRWRDSFENFLADMGECPEGKSIDRRDNDGPYDPNNCYWASAVEQANNKRRTVFVEFRGERIAVALLAARFGIPSPALYERIVRYGWSTEEAVAAPVTAKIKLTDDQVAMIRIDPRSGRIIAADFGISQSYVSHIKAGRERRKQRR